MKSDLQEKLLSNVDKDDDHSGRRSTLKRCSTMSITTELEKTNSTTSNIASLLNI